MVGGGGDGGGGGGDNDASPALDGGVPVSDAGEGIDAGDAPDAGPPDAGTPACACPTLPTSCTPPALNQPVFTLGDDELLQQLFGVIACAESSLDLAIYQGDWECLSGAISSRLEADSDLTVRIVVDNESCSVGDCFADDLEAHPRVTLVRDTRVGSLMHHKVVVADGQRMWVGSANFSEFSFCSDHNNGLVLEESEIVGRYLTEFDRMFGGDFSPIDAVDGEGTTSGIYTLYFSPVSPTDTPGPWFSAMEDAISEATTSIDIMTNAWTRQEIANAILNRLDAVPELSVRVLVSDLYADDLPAQLLAADGRIDIRRGRFHDKVMLIDEDTVVTGSANWSRNAWSNNEVQLWVADTNAAAVYTAEFDAVFEGARPVEAMP